MREKTRMQSTSSTTCKGTFLLFKWVWLNAYFRGMDDSLQERVVCSVGRLLRSRCQGEVCWLLQWTEMCLRKILDPGQVSVQAPVRLRPVNNDQQEVTSCSSSHDWHPPIACSLSVVCSSSSSAAPCAPLIGSVSRIRIQRILLIWGPKCVFYYQCYGYVTMYVTHFVCQSFETRETSSGESDCGSVGSSDEDIDTTAPWKHNINTAAHFGNIFIGHAIKLEWECHGFLSLSSQQQGLFRLHHSIASLGHSAQCVQ